MMLFRVLTLSLILSGCANWQNAGINRAHVIGPSGEEWDIVSGKDQTNTRLDITKNVDGSVTASYKSDKEDATAALKAAFDALANTIDKLTNLVASMKPTTGPQ
jgi:hypothetical protein